MSLDFRRACLEIRERFHLDGEAIQETCARLRRRGADGVVIVQTCNRLEAYCWWPVAGERPGEPWDARGPLIRNRIGHEICLGWTAGDEDAALELHRHAELRGAPDTIEHLLRVVSGLESQVLGDIHVLCQVRSAFREAVAQGAVGSHLHRLFETAFRTGKRVKRETALMQTRSGVGSEAARLAISSVGKEGIVVVGCGKIGSQAARALLERGVRDLTVVNRTVSRAERLVEDLGAGRAESIDRLGALLREARAVVVATDARNPVLTRSLVAQARGSTGLPSPITVIDVSVPRNVEPEVGKFDGITLVDLDTFHPEARETVDSRCAAVPQAEALVAEASAEFLAWLELDTARRALHPLRSVLADVCRREIEFMTGEAGDAARVADRIVARVLSHPMSALRSARARGENVNVQASTLESLFV